MAFTSFTLLKYIYMIYYPRRIQERIFNALNISSNSAIVSFKILFFSKHIFC